MADPDMKTLYLLRHAKSSWKDPHLSDHQRPLNKRGKRDVPEMAGRLKARAVRPDLVISSDARRALDTAIPLVEGLGLDPSLIRREPELYHATQGSILDIVRALEDRWQRVMIVGHNPGLNDFVNRYDPRPIDNLPTAGIVELRFDIRRWRRIDRCRLIFSDFDFPKKRPPATGSPGTADAIDISG
jgi:phosphohistidine phosphatase